MKLLSHLPLLRLLAFGMALLFAGDLAADAAADLVGGHCGTPVSQSSGGHDQEPCSHCSCAVHAGAVLVPELGTRWQGTFSPTDRLPGDDAAAPPRLASRIDHPPQLA